MKTVRAIALFALALLPFSVLAETAYLCPSNGEQFQELRIYEINRSNRDAFHKRFENHAIRFMKKHGFHLVDAWESDTGEKLQFVYILSWPDKATMDARWKAFQADQEWSGIRKRSVEEHGDLLLAPSDGQQIVRMSYSPACKVDA